MKIERIMEELGLQERDMQSKKELSSFDYGRTPFAQDDKTFQLQYIEKGATIIMTNYAEKGKKDYGSYI